jgi:protein-L-isoaspartate(D-aspartate) O-methyltransferase
MQEDHTAERESMVTDQLAWRGIHDQRVLNVMRKVRRHLFVPESLRPSAYYDGPLSIGEGQTISQPYMVALMTELLKLRGREKVLEIGTGSGYQTAILSELAGTVYSIELIKPLMEKAEALLSGMGYANIHLRCGDGYAGWPEEAPFDAIIVTAAPEEVPPSLLEQLKAGGRMVVPIGGYCQELDLFIKTERRVIKKEITKVFFVPMVHGKEKSQ